MALKIKSWYGIIILATVFSVAGQYEGAGTTIFPIVNMNFDARSAALSGASVALPNGIYGTLSNPASIGFIDKTEVLLGYLYVLDGVWGGPLGVARPMGKFGVFGVNLIGLTSGNIDVVEEQNGAPVVTGATASSNYYSAALSWAYCVQKNISVGLNLKGLFNTIRTPQEYYLADGVAIDAGVQYRLFSGRFISGLVFRNIGFVYHSYTQDDNYKLPYEVDAGVSYIPRSTPTLRMALDVNKTRGDYMNFKPGLEFDVYKKQLMARLGYGFSERDIQEMINNLKGEPNDQYIKSNWSGFCIGAGISTKMENSDLAVDLALQFRSFYLPPSFAASAVIKF
jgi:hypothetical protein